MNPSPIARKLNCPGRKMPARKATIDRTTAARKQIVETIRNCRSTQKYQFKSCTGAWQTSVCLRCLAEILTTVSNMNTKRLILAIVVAFVVLWVTDFLIHGVWMMPDYRGTQQLWRTDAAMGSRMGWMLGAQLLFAITFVLLWTRWAETARLGCAIGYGFLMGLFSGTWAIIMFVVVPMPGSIAAKWFLCWHLANNPARPRHLFCLQTQV